jgi:lipopolysaccharide biosynthesis protein
LRVTPRVSLGPDVAILCHYDRDGAIRSDTLRYLREVRDAGFSIVVVSNGGTLHSDAAVTELGGIALSRRNIGLDFGAWRMAMRTLGLPRLDTNRILLINDSVYGPVAPLAPLLARMTADGADLWGLTDSLERGWHLQSYFLLAHRPLIRSDMWRRLWPGVVPLPFKRWMVGRYEIGLSRRTKAAGFRARALFPYAAIVPDGSIANPTLGAWRALLSAGFPFVKRELLRDNPTGVTGLETWQASVSPACAAEIEADLRRRG